MTTCENSPNVQLGMMQRWCRALDLLYNRVDSVNYCLGAERPNLHGNPCVVSRSGPRASVSLYGCGIADYTDWDLTSTLVALERLGAASDVVWALSRAGVLRASV